MWLQCSLREGEDQQIKHSSSCRSLASVGVESSAGVSMVVDVSLVSDMPFDVSVLSPIVFDASFSAILSLCSFSKNLSRLSRFSFFNSFSAASVSGGRGK